LAFPKIGAVKAGRILADCGIAHSKTLGGLTERQRTSSGLPGLHLAVAISTTSRHALTSRGPSPAEKVDPRRWCRP
jgi:hypothetical protein